MNKFMQIAIKEAQQGMQTDAQYEELKVSFALVANLEVIEDIEAPTKQSSQELREQTYMPYKMISLIP